MKEALIATAIFWSTFVFSIGPFWVVTMEAAKDSSFTQIYKNYCLYLIVGWFPEIALICFVVGILGGVNPTLFTSLYFIGGLIIFYLAYKTLSIQTRKTEKFDFNWKTMMLVSWTNPKVWLTIPPGFLAATYTDSLWMNIIIFFLMGVPLFLFGVYFWGMIGRQGAKISRNKLSYFNAALLFGFGLYLIYQGIQLVS